MGKVLETLAEVATEEVKGTGKFTIPGLCMLKTRKKPATKAGKREVFGKVMMVKAKPAKTIVKAYPVSALVAGFTRVFTMQRPGITNLPALFTSLVATPARLL